MTDNVLIAQSSIWDDLDSMLDPHLFIGRSAEIVERFFGSGGVVEARLAKYRRGIENMTTAALHV